MMAIRKVMAIPILRRKQFKHTQVLVMSRNILVKVFKVLTGKVNERPDFFLVYRKFNTDFQVHRSPIDLLFFSIENLSTIG